MITIKNLTDPMEIAMSEMSVVRGGSHACGPDMCFTPISVDTFTKLLNEGALRNPANLIAAASQASFC